MKVICWLIGHHAVYGIWTSIYEDDITIPGKTAAKLIVAHCDRCRSKL